jgi:hypothetical protein
MNKFLIIATTLQLAVTTACDRWRSAVQPATEQQSAAPLAVICPICLDGCTCTPATLAQSLGVALARASEDGVPVELWTSTAAQPAAPVATVQPHKPQRRASARVHKAEQDAWVAKETKTLVSLVQPEFDKVSAPPRKGAAKAPEDAQRLADALALVAHAHATEGPRTVIAITSGREASRWWDMPCKLVDSSAFAQRLATGPMPAASMAGVHVEMWWVTRQQPSRTGCVSTPKKEIAQDNSWTLALGRAGASVSFHLSVSALGTLQPASTPVGATPQKEL